MMARLILPFIFLLAYQPLRAGDGPYAGGVGDGFAQAALEWEALAVGQISVHETAVYPSPAKPGLEIFAPGATGITVAVLYDAAGRSYPALERTGAHSWRLPQVPPGLYHIQWRGERGQRYFSRLVITAF